MSCIATFYLFDSGQREAIVAAKSDEKREVVTKRFLLFTRRETVGEMYLSEWLEENCVKQDDLNASGFVNVALTSEIYDAAEEITGQLFGDSLDEYASLIDSDRAKLVLKLLSDESLEDEKIVSFLKAEYNVNEEEMKGVVEAYRYTHQWLIKWLEAVAEEKVGVLYLSF